MASESLDSMLMCTNPENEQQEQKKPRPADEQALKCPRCDSSNTKFCYYNNYSLTQPRYFCKSCRRYWTKGGTLRNVPVGGGCRRNKRSSSLTRRSTPDYNLHHHQVSDLITNSASSYDNHHALNLANNNANVSILGGHGNSHFDLFGHQSGGNNNSFLEALRGGLIDNNQHFLYYGLGSGNANYGDVEANNNANVSHDDRRDIGMRFNDRSNSLTEIMSNPSSGSSTPTIKQEFGENKILWGLPWQLNNNEGSYINGGNQESWNNAIGVTWNNLLNSPLM